MPSGGPWGLRLGGRKPLSGDSDPLWVFFLGAFPWLYISVQMSSLAVGLMTILTVLVHP